MIPKKITVWRNPTRISPRIDAEIVYADGTRERKICLPADTMERAIKLLKEGE